MNEETLSSLLRKNIITKEEFSHWIAQPEEEAISFLSEKISTKSLHAHRIACIVASAGMGVYLLLLLTFWLSGNITGALSLVTLPSAICLLISLVGIAKPGKIPSLALAAFSAFQCALFFLFMALGGSLLSTAIFCTGPFFTLASSIVALKKSSDILKAKAVFAEGDTPPLPKNEPTPNNNAVVRTNSEKDTPAKTRRALALIIATIAMVALIVGLFVVSKMHSVNNAIEKHRHVFTEYSEETLDLNEIDQAYHELSEAGALGMFGNDEDKQLFETVYADVEKEYPYYETYRDLQSTHENVKSNPMTYLATKEDRKYTFARYQKAIDEIPEDDRFFQPANDLLSEAQGLVDEAESAYQEKQEEERAKAEEEARREQAEQERKEAEEAAKKDQVLVNEPGKQMYQLTAYGSVFHMEADYEGSGNFIVKLLDSNQDLQDLMANEIGSYHMSKSVPITPGCTYYLVVESSYGSWSGTWTGSYGN